MPSFYLDTSAIVKIYAREPGTEWMTTLVEPALGHALYTVRMTGPEAIAALSRKARTGEISASDADRAGQVFRQDWQGRRYLVVAVTAALAEQAMDLAERYGLRGYDAVHIAAALAVVARQRRVNAPILTFISADVSQRQAANAESLPVDDPTGYT